MFSLDDDQKLLHTPLTDTEDDSMTITLMETRDSLKLIKGESSSATFLPISQNLGRNNRINYGPRDSLTPQHPILYTKR